MPQPVAQTALEMLHQRTGSLLTLGCPILDKCLGGGIPVCSITEFVGEASVGKTQIALQLLLTVQLPVVMGGLEGSAVFISTEGAFPSTRLTQLAEEFANEYHKEYSESNTKRNFLDDIYLMHANSVEDLHSVLTRDVPVLADRSSIKLVVIDSIAAVLRGDFDSSQSDLLERSYWIWEIGYVVHA